MDQLKSYVIGLQAVTETLQLLNIPSSRDNLEHMLGCLHKIDEIRLGLISMIIEDEKAKEKENQNGTGNE